MGSDEIPSTLAQVIHTHMFTYGMVTNFIYGSYMTETFPIYELDVSGTHHRGAGRGAHLHGLECTSMVTKLRTSMARNSTRVV